MHALSVETVFAIYHLTFPWLKAGSIMCGSSSNQHFHQSSFQKNMSIRKARWCRAEGEKEDRGEPAASPVHLGTLPELPVCSPGLFTLPL